MNARPEKRAYRGKSLVKDRPKRISVETEGFALIRHFQTCTECLRFRFNLLARTVATDSLVEYSSVLTSYHSEWPFIMSLVLFPLAQLEGARLVRASEICLRHTAITLHKSYFALGLLAKAEKCTK
jgi:hypothetical protein